MRTDWIRKLLNQPIFKVPTPCPSALWCFQTAQHGIPEPPDFVFFLGDGNHLPTEVVKVQVPLSSRSLKVMVAVDGKEPREPVFSSVVVKSIHCIHV